MKINLPAALIATLIIASCNGGKKGIPETRTSGTLTMFVDESFSDIIEDQVKVFRYDYPDTKITTVKGPEGRILPAFLNDSLRVIVMSRELTPEENKFYEARGIRVNPDRFAVDGVALITSKGSADSNITAQSVIDVFKGKSAHKLVFDNAYSSTLSYFKNLAQVDSLPKNGIYTQNTNNEVIRFVANNKGYIGVVGLNWLLHNNGSMTGDIDRIMLMNVKNLPGKKGDDDFYKPTQKNLMNGFYAFPRNIYVINAEGRDGLGTGFATWLTSERGQLIVLRSGLAPDELKPRQINLKKK